MKTGSSAPKQAPTAQHAKSKQDQQLASVASSQRSIFISLALNMSWQLAIVVLVPIVAGVELDKAFGTNNILLYVGLGLAVLGSGAVMWRAVQRANRMPVPKLTEEQKRAIKKAYEEEDKDE